MPEPLWEPIRTASLSARIIGQVREALFAGHLKAGDFVGSEAALAQRFGVSRIAVRDALQSLQAAGIVEIRMGAKGGAWIAEGNPNRFADALAIQLKLIGVLPEEIIDAQIAIEVMAADLAARNATAEDHLRLEALLAELAARREDFPAFTEAALRFHEAVVEASHNRALSAQFRALRLVLEPVYAPTTCARTVQRVLSGDRALLDALEARDPVKARDLLHARLSTIRAYHAGERDAVPGGKNHG
ncbi:MAG TPA: FCD domain-containing protein [Candidatus Limnocylindria bacterium]|nr:FCD domain-containing protein [Candidatus Limnocylindria bacterium]